MHEEEPEDCIRSMLKINGENYYLLVGESFATPTVPRENSPQMSGTRMLVETICAEITKSLEKMTERREQKIPAQSGYVDQAGI